MFVKSLRGTLKHSVFHGNLFVKRKYDLKVFWTSIIELLHLCRESPQGLPPPSLAPYPSSSGTTWWVCSRYFPRLINKPTSLFMANFYGIWKQEVLLRHDTDKTLDKQKFPPDDNTCPVQCYAESCLTTVGTVKFCCCDLNIWTWWVTHFSVMSASPPQSVSVA